MITDEPLARRIQYCIKPGKQECVIRNSLVQASRNCH